jgi:hypothetical protein
MSTLTIDEGTTNGIRTKVHFNGDEDIIFEKTFDAAPILQYAADARLATEGKSWGEGKLVGHIPAVYLAPIIAIKDRKEREQAVNTFFRQNPAFVMFDRFLK